MSPFSCGEDLVVADPIDPVREHPDELLAGLGEDVGDVLVTVAQVTVMTLSSAAKPRRTWKGSHGLLSSHSPKQSEMRPGCPKHDLLTAPGREPPTFRMTRRSARPIVAFDRPLWPRHE
jgi:hypothetical protein